MNYTALYELRLLMLLDDVMFSFNLRTQASKIIILERRMSQDTLRTIYFSYFHSILSYGIIFWGNSAYSCNIFKIQKRIIRIIMNARNRYSCRQLFKYLKILRLKSQYIFSLLLLVAKNRDLYKSNSEIHSINSRFSSDSNSKL